MSNGGEEVRFIGVRKRKWGKYVAEIRSGKRSRISLGSYITPVAAARAYDAALLCLRRPNATPFNFPDSKFKTSAIFVADGHNNPSPQLIRAIALDVDSACDTVPTKILNDNVQAGHSCHGESSNYVGQGVNGRDTVQGEDVCGADETKYLLQSPEGISFEERVQMSLLLPDDKEMTQPYEPPDFFPDETTTLLYF